MPGGSWESYDALGPILEDISAHVGDEPCCTEAVFARATSSHRELREHAQAALDGPDRTITDVGDAASRQQVIDDIRDALWASKVVAYAQGLDEIRTASQEYGWDINVAEVAKIWRAGCIIRAKLLERIRSEYAAGDLVTLLEAPSVKSRTCTLSGRVASSGVSCRYSRSASAWFRGGSRLL